MDQCGCNWHWAFVMFVVISIMAGHIETSSTPVINPIKLSDTEVRYLTERLKKHERMCDHDIRYTIAELEHFYTVVKNTDGMYGPSPIVDKAWHHHILNTKMYNMFSRRHFGIELLHHEPFWSGNEEETEEVLEATDGFSPMSTYDILVTMFGAENVNKTVWLMNEDGELDDDPLEIEGHTEI